MAKRKAKKKAAKYTLIKADEPAGREMYALLARLVEADHEELRPARIALAWAWGGKPDVDGRVKLGACKRAGDLDRELSPYDFVVLLAADWWQSATTTDEQRAALMDHELSHAAAAVDQEGEQREDGKGRLMWRVRKHDVEEFSGVVRRHGIYKRDLEAFATALRAAPKQAGLFDAPDPEAQAAVRRAVEGLRPRKGSGVESVSLHVAGHELVEG